jgi:hypothetical protein
MEKARAAYETFASAAEKPPSSKVLEKGDGGCAVVRKRLGMAELNP